MRLLSALLYLYPASFRADYGREMEEIVGARMRETRFGSPPKASRVTRSRSSRWLSGSDVLA